MALCLSVISRYSIESAERIKLVFGTKVSFLHFMEIQVSTEIRVLPSETLSETRDLEYFDHRGVLSA